MKTNIHLKKLVRDLKRLSREQNVNIWKRIAEDLDKSARNKREVNVFKIDKYTKDNETIIVPGKVLGDGELTHNVNVAAWRFSESAKEKIKGSMSIEDLMKKNPKGKDVRIIG